MTMSSILREKIATVESQMKLKLDERIEIRTDYLSGFSIQEIMDKHKKSRDLVLKVLNDDDKIARRLAEEGILQKMQQETDSVLQIKEQGLQVIREALISVQNSENPHLFLDKVAKAIETLDRIQRLNQSRPTEIQEHRHTHTIFDIAKLICRSPDA